MHNLNYRADVNQSRSSRLAELEQKFDKNNSSQNKTRAFSSRTCVVALAVGSAIATMGALYYLASSQSSSGSRRIHVRRPNLKTGVFIISENAKRLQLV
uniref:hypothetical protein n=1 Tax=Endozoicomonas sp. ALB115 TaxID=3403074 RepID=UPI003BB77EF5